MDHIGGSGPRVPPVHLAARLTSGQDRRHRRTGIAPRGFASDDPAEEQSVDGTPNRASKAKLLDTGLAWWSALASAEDHGVEADAAKESRLRTVQMLRAVRDMAAMGQVGSTRVKCGPQIEVITGEVLEADTPGGDGARVIDSGRDV